MSFSHEAPLSESSFSTSARATAVSTAMSGDSVAEERRAVSLVRDQLHLNSLATAPSAAAVTTAAAAPPALLSRSTISRDVIERFRDYDFGRAAVTCVELSQMARKGTDGYYLCHGRLSLY